MKIERSSLFTHLPMSSDEATHHRRRLLIALGAGISPVGSTSGSSAAAQRMRPGSSERDAHEYTPQNHLGAGRRHACQRACDQPPRIRAAAGQSGKNLARRGADRARLARPGGNITGTSLMMIEIMPKRLEHLLGMVPKLTRVAALFNPANSTSVASLASLQAAAATLRIKIVPAEAHRAGDRSGVCRAQARQSRSGGRDPRCAAQ